jgi:fumarate hydratase subunit beta
MRIIRTPLENRDIGKLKAGDQILLSGVIYTARDQAHARLADTIAKRKKLPLDFKGQIIFYCGPTPDPKGKTIGSCGPTTSSRMDRFTPILLQKGLKGMIGKGGRSSDVVKAIKKYKTVYFLAPAGAGAYLAKCVREARIIAYPDLGPEAIYKLKVKNFPLIVGIDSWGRNIY